MNIGYVAVALLIFALVLFIWGAWGISKYAFRISTGKGVATLLFPPYTFYFSFYELEEEGKEQPIFLWMWGIVVIGVITFVFWSPLSMVAQGRAAELSADIGVDAAVEKYKDKSKARPESDENAEPVESDEPADSPEDSETPTAESEGEEGAEAEEGASGDAPEGAEGTEAADEKEGAGDDEGSE